MVIGEGMKVEVVKQFCYLGDALEVEGVEGAMTARIRSGWRKFRELQGI